MSASVLLAPIPITPTKALTPSHVKGILWLDVIYKATQLLGNVTYKLNRVAYDTSQQTLGFWQYLDERYPDASSQAAFEGASELWISQQYVECYRAAPVFPKADVALYQQRVERDLWTHAASSRLLDVWKGQFEQLNAYDAGLHRAVPLEMTVEAVLERLRQADALLDLRKIGGPVYLDLTEQGRPLRQIIDRDGVYNYLVCTLRELLPIAREHETIVLVCDEDIRADYEAIQQVLQRMNIRTTLIGLGRVPIDGKTLSSRHGGWENYLFSKLTENFLPRFGEAVFRLGMRIYFIMHLGRAGKETFSYERVELCLKKAERFLSRTPRVEGEFAEELTAMLQRLSPHGYVDPYRLITHLMQMPGTPLAGELVSRVFV